LEVVKHKAFRNVGSDRNSQVLQVDFINPMVVPAGVERILVEVLRVVYPIQ
jgi:hypothetical protein